MNLYAHRGNIDGIDTNNENRPEYIIDAIEEGFFAEVDVHYFDGSFLLGHDNPTYEVNESFLENPKIICHAKTAESFMRMMFNIKIHSFWHDKDLYTITSKQFFWTLDDSSEMDFMTDFYKLLHPIIGKRILCDPTYDKPLTNWHRSNYIGICTDFVGRNK